MIEGTETTVTNEGNVSEPIVTPATETAVASNEPVVVQPVEPAKPKRSRKPKRSCKAKAKAKPAKVKPAKVSVKRGRGRPAVFTGNVKRHIVSVIRQHGLTGGRALLAQEGTSISLPTLGKFAAEAGIELHRGRPKAA